MAAKIKIAFEMELIDVPINNLRPDKEVTADMLHSPQFKKIVSSVQQVGLVEPITIFPIKDRPGLYTILDGHLRHEALKHLNAETARCVIATDDERYTYNKVVTGRTTIEEDTMHLEAMRNGVRKEEIQIAFGFNDHQMTKIINLQKGLCEKAITLLKNKVIDPKIINVLKQMKPERQVKAIEVMLEEGFTFKKARFLKMCTPSSELVNPDKAHIDIDLTDEQKHELEEEKAQIKVAYDHAVEGIGENSLNLIPMLGYVERMLKNKEVYKYLEKKHPEKLTSLQSSLGKFEVAA